MTQKYKRKPELDKLLEDNIHRHFSKDARLRTFPVSLPPAPDPNIFGEHYHVRSALEEALKIARASRVDPVTGLNIKNVAPIHRRISEITAAAEKKIRKVLGSPKRSSMKFTGLSLTFLDRQANLFGQPSVVAWKAAANPDGSPSYNREWTLRMFFTIHGSYENQLGDETECPNRSATARVMLHFLQDLDKNYQTDFHSEILESSLQRTVSRNADAFIRSLSWLDKIIPPLRAGIELYRLQGAIKNK